MDPISDEETCFDEESYTRPEEMGIKGTYENSEHRCMLGICEPSGEIKRYNFSFDMNMPEEFVEIPNLYNDFLNIESISLENVKFTDEFLDLINIHNISLKNCIIDNEYNRYDGYIEEYNYGYIENDSKDINRFEGYDPRYNYFPDQLLKDNKIDSIYINNLNLNGKIPEEFYKNMNKLDLFMLSGSNLTGKISPNISQLINLTYLDLSNNRLYGELPEELWQLKNIRQLILSNNHLTGEISNKIGEFKKLELIMLTANRFYGKFPFEVLKNLKSLTNLHIAYNNFSGEINPSDFNPNLLSVMINNNLFTGSASNFCSLLDKVMICKCHNNLFK